MVSTRVSGKANPQVNFLRWKRAVGLPPEFPALSHVNDDELDPEVGLYIGYVQESTNKQILNSMKNPRLAVLVNKGHGCSTLSRYIHKQSEELSVIAARIPVHLALDDLDGSKSDFFEDVAQRVRGDVISSLVWLDWDKALGKRPYADLIGAVGRSENTVDAQRNAIKSALNTAGHRWTQSRTVRVPRTVSLAEPDWEEIRELSSTLGKPLDELLVDLAQVYGLAVSFQIDLSSSTFQDEDGEYTRDYERNVVKLSSAVKGLLERVGQRTPVSVNSGLPRERSAGPVSLMLFTGDYAYDAFTSPWNQTFEEIEYPPYGPTDVFAILSYHYPQKMSTTGLVRTSALATVISDELVHDVYDTDQSLAQITRDLEGEILKLMENWNKVPMRLVRDRARDANEDGRAPRA